MPDEFDKGFGTEGDEPSSDDRLIDPPSFFPRDDADAFRESATPSEPIQVQIDGIFRSESNGSVSQFVLLTTDELRLPIMIGPFEAQAILASLEQERPDRPMTHDLIRTVIERLGGNVTRVLIDDLWNGVFYAKIFVEKDGTEMPIDSRPSDAIAVAVRFDAPVFVNSNVFDLAIDE